MNAWLTCLVHPRLEMRWSMYCMKPLFLILFASLTASAADFKATNTGIEITAGSLGSFTLSYPEFEPAHKIIEVKAVSGSAMLRYEGGAQCVVSAGKDEIGIVFKDVSGDVKSWKMTTLIDIGFAKGGSWRIADKEGVFPGEKASPPHIASLNGTSFMVKNAQGQSLSFLTPDTRFSSSRTTASGTGQCITGSSSCRMRRIERSRRSR